MKGWLVYIKLIRNCSIQHGCQGYERSCSELDGVDSTWKPFKGITKLQPGVDVTVVKVHTLCEITWDESVNSCVGWGWEGLEFAAGHRNSFFYGALESLKT